MRWRRRPRADWVFLTLKPQTAVGVLPTLRPLLLPHSVVLSVMTGISLAYLRKALDHGRLVEYTGANRCRSLRMQGRGPDRPCAKLSPAPFECLRRGNIGRRRTLYGYGHGAFGHGASVCVYLHGGAHRCGCAYRLAPSSCRENGRCYAPRLCALLRSSAEVHCYFTA